VRQQGNARHTSSVGARGEAVDSPQIDRPARRHEADRVKTAIRFDQGTLRKPERTPQGFLKVDALVARCGVLEYRNPNGTIRRELRLREDVGDPTSLAAFEGVSVTDGHPTVLVTADNVRTLEAGTVTGTARMDGEWVVAPMVIKDPKLIAKIERGETGVSAGYTIREDWTPGVHPVYGPYDLIQRNIGPNHIAGAVKVPRAGDGARIRMDGVDVLVEESSAAERSDSQIDRSGAVEQPGGTMKLEEQVALLNTQLAEATARASQAEADLKTRTDERDDARGKLAIAEQTAKDAQARLDSGLDVAETAKVKEVQTRLDEANAKLREVEGSIPELVRKRAALNTRASAIMGADFRADGMDEESLLDAVNLRIDPKANVKALSVVEKKARFDAFYDGRAATAASTARVGAAIAVRTDTQQPTESDPFDPLHNGAGQYASPHAAKKGA
jgi:hypothetical protein